MFATTIAVLAWWASASLAAAPALRLDSVSNTTAVPSGAIRYLLQINNIGDGPTNGTPLTLVATLPPGLTGTDAYVFFPGDNRCQGDGPGAAPNIIGASTITCTLSGVLPARVGVRHPTVTVAVDPSLVGSMPTTTFTVSGGGAGSASTADSTQITSIAPGFGVGTFDGQVSADSGGAPFSQAAGHPFAASTSFDFNTTSNIDHDPIGLGDLWPVEPTKDIVVDLPPGFIGNPTGTAQCTTPELANGASIQPLPLCAPSSQVGTTLIRINGFGGNVVLGPIPVYNMVPPPDAPARFGFNVVGTVVTFTARLRSASDYGVSVDVTNVSEGLAVASTSLTLWGVPADPSHDEERACAGDTYPSVGGPTCPVGSSVKPFLRNPTACTAPGVGLPTRLSIDSWEHPGARTADGDPAPNDPNWQSATFISHNPPAYPFPIQPGTEQGPTNCDQVPFTPTIKAQPNSPAKAGKPAGFTFDVNLPQPDDPNSIGEGDLKQAVVTLPEGVRVSPSSAGGLGACSESQIGLIGTGFPEPNKIHFDIADPTCPDSSKLGSVTITTPLLDQPLAGSIYLATPNDNPFHSLIAIYLVVKGQGVIAKFPGEVTLNKDTGQATATFDDNPQTPFTNVHLEFKGGPRAPLVLPTQCGTYTTHAELTSWSGKTVSSDDSFTLSADGNGAPCAPLGFSPSFSAGTTNPVAGTDSPFVLSFSRGDQDQELSGLALDMPTGLLGRIANAVLCSDGAANAGTCTDASQIGGVTVGAGAGTNPFYITSGRAYITGPYKGAPYGLSIVVPAVAGPFDLGNVVVRAAAFVNRTTAQLKVVSDPLPTILQGIPLDVRDVRVAVDKPHFIVNPTSCAVKQVAGTLTSTQDAVAHVSSRFQVGECANLAFAPKLSMTVGARKHTQAGVSTPVTATVTMPPRGANLRATSVTLPASLNALLPVVNRACKLTEFQAGKCGNQAKIGTAVAVTPLLRDPLKGPVYFVKNPARILPDLMIALRGQVALDVTAKVSIPGGKRLGTLFDTIPDAPITKFTLRIVSGKNGPVGIATNLCSAKGRAAAASVGYRGQNGKVIQLSVRPHIAGCPKAAKARKAKH